MMNEYFGGLLFGDVCLRSILAFFEVSKQQIYSILWFKTHVLYYI